MMSRSASDCALPNRVRPRATSTVNLPKGPTPKSHPPFQLHKVPPLASYISPAPVEIPLQPFFPPLSAPLSRHILSAPIRQILAARNTNGILRLFACDVESFLFSSSRFLPANSSLSTPIMLRTRSDLHPPTHTPPPCLPVRVASQLRRPIFYASFLSGNPPPTTKFERLLVSANENSVAALLFVRRAPFGLLSFMSPSR